MEWQGLPCPGKSRFATTGWFRSGLGTLILQAPAWPFFAKLELQKYHSQAGAWERAKKQDLQLSGRNPGSGTCEAE